LTNPPWAGGSIFTTIQPEDTKGRNGWWIIIAEFWNRIATFRAYYPDEPPTARRFFEDISLAVNLLKTKGPLEAVMQTGGVEGGLSAKEAYEQLEEDDRKMRYLLDEYYPLFEYADTKFFSVFIA